MKKIFALIVAVIIIFALAGCMKFEKLDFDRTGAPVIKVIPKQKMLIAESRGTAEEAAGKAISSVYAVFFVLKAGGKVMAAPRARWLNLPDAPKDAYHAEVALPVPENVTQLPEMKKQTPAGVRLGYWEYGETAEILHTGSYDSEKATVDKLMLYIKEKGYKISGPHEEVYIKGPGMFGKGDPGKYLTLIRYQVQKTGSKKTVK